MACGCPVICSAAGSLGEVVGEAAIIIEPHDVTGLAAQLYALATDEKARGRLREAGIVQSAKFNWKTAAQQTIAVFERAGKSNGKG
jgi:glycosyltransferase involved in cell wall biosynthesis